MNHKSRSVKNAALLLPVLLALGISSAHAAPNCSAMTQPIYQAVNPKTGVHLLTPWQNEAESAKQYGFTDFRGAVFYGSLQPGQELTATARLYHTKSGDFFWTGNENERNSAVNKYGYTLNKPADFYSAQVPSATCTQPVYSLIKGAIHRLTADAAERRSLQASGWTYEGIKFYAKPAPGKPDNPGNNSTFSFAVIPDTQKEAQSCWVPAEKYTYDPRVRLEACGPNQQHLRTGTNDWRLKERMQWLVDSRNQFNLRYVAHSGDLVSWGERDEHQYKVAADAYQILRTANIPFTIAAGNHETRAVCGSGDKCYYSGYNPSVEVRNTPRFNQYMGSLMAPYVAGQYRTGEFTNTYSTFEGGGLKWMVLTLELWPRDEVIDWAKRQVAAHPNYNVIVVTHSYLEENDTISGSQGGYGATSPQNLYKNLIHIYPNIRFVFSGHVGDEEKGVGSRVDWGQNGNKIVSFRQAIHSGTTNPTRIVEIDPKTDSVKSYVYAPKTKQYFGNEVNQPGMNFIR